MLYVVLFQRLLTNYSTFAESAAQVAITLYKYKDSLVSFVNHPIFQRARTRTCVCVCVRVCAGVCVCVCVHI